MSDLAHRQPTGMQGASARLARAKLQVWLSPSFPIGAYAYSHGLEKAVELGWINSRTTLAAWLADIVAHGSLRNDLIFIAEAHRCTPRTAPANLRMLADLSAAMQPSAERHLEATQQGLAFLQQIDRAWPAGANPLVDLFAGSTPTVPVVLGVSAHLHAIAVEDATMAYAIAFMSNLVSASIRLSTIGQSDGQHCLAELLPAIAATAASACEAGLDDLGSASFRGDIASMQHETQHTRLFRS